MKPLKTTITCLFLFSTVFAWASEPQNNNTTSIGDSSILKYDGIFYTGNTASYGGASGYQEPLFQQIQYGGKVGFNFTSNGPHPSFFTNPEFGPVIGPTIALPFLTYFGVRLELLYSQNVFSGQTSVDGQPTAYINRLSYIDIPLILQIKPVDNLTLLAGTDLSLLIRNKYIYSELPPGAPSNNLSSPKGSSIGYLFGIEYSVYGVVGGFRLTMGVPDNNNLPSPKTIIGQFTVGYAFQVGQTE